MNGRAFFFKQQQQPSVCLSALLYVISQMSFCLFEYFNFYQTYTCMSFYKAKKLYKTLKKMWSLVPHFPISNSLLPDENISMLTWFLFFYFLITSCISPGSVQEIGITLDILNRNGFYKGYQELLKSLKGLKEQVLSWALWNDSQNNISLLGFPLMAFL